MTSHQCSASLGAAVLGTIAGTATAGYLDSHSPAADLAARAAVHGFNVASLAGAAVLCLATVVVFLVAGAKRPNQA